MKKMLTLVVFVAVLVGFVGQVRADWDNIMRNMSPQDALSFASYLETQFPTDGEWKKGVGAEFWSEYRLKSGVVNLQNISLPGGNFRMFDFSGMNLIFCNFKKANFSKTNLRNNVFIDCGLKGTNWKDAKPGRTEFFGKFFSDRVTDLDGANINFICWSSRGSEYVLFDTVSFFGAQIDTTNIQLDFLNCQFDDSSKMTDNVLAFSSFRSCQGINRADF